MHECWYLIMQIILILNKWRIVIILLLFKSKEWMNLRIKKMKNHAKNMAYVTTSAFNACDRMCVCSNFRGGWAYSYTTAWLQPIWSRSYKKIAVRQIFSNFLWFSWWSIAHLPVQVGSTCLAMTENYKYIL